ncbi:putative calpain-like protein [Phaeomoniella chlamydospora]|uniref:Putative calpain-like protein n=1 Tax=Phaeomoniella chlamydospora TaxID=158046 RepID=A0A0G2EZ38_PHACM|nr:putative calpain-like protein [Phaeomoniella chlamydospora]
MQYDYDVAVPPPPQPTGPGVPHGPHAQYAASRTPAGVVQGQQAVKSYNEAYAECKRDVERTIRECRRVNQKYRDPHFDIELDLKLGNKNCLFGLNREDDSINPRGVKRVTDIFENPQFFIGKPTADDVRQGHDGDCWLMSALSALGTKDGLIENVCVKHDQEPDGEWQQCIVDDKLYLRAADYDESVEERKVWNKIDRKAEEEEYAKAYQTGSRALYFASCSDENETWLPLLEKAYAKLHGDYISIESGFVGEAIEDLTGGVTSEIFATDVLDKDRFWDEELSKANDKFLFGCSTGHFSNWLDPSRGAQTCKGIVQKHAYSIIEARTVNGIKLVKLRNPWAEVEWTGAWSDGSKEWTPEWMQLLNHKFGDDGVFWMTYQDLLKKYQHFDRTRLFDETWTISQLWTTIDVPWSTADYHNTKFSLTLKKKSEVVIVLSQLDTRYWKDLQGQYEFTLSFRLQRDGDDDDDYIVRSHGNIALKRSVSTDIELDPGTYSVLMKVTAWRDEDADTPEDVIREWACDRPAKLMALGLSYDLAHAKGRIVETEEEKQERKHLKEQEKAKARAKLREKSLKVRQKEYEREKKRAARTKRAQAKEDRARHRRGAKADATRYSRDCFPLTDGAESMYPSLRQPKDGDHSSTVLDGKRIEVQSAGKLSKNKPKAEESSGKGTEEVDSRKVPEGQSDAGQQVDKGVSDVKSVPGATKPEAGPATTTRPKEDNIPDSPVTALQEVEASPCTQNSQPDERLSEHSKSTEVESFSTQHIFGKVNRDADIHTNTSDSSMNNQFQARVHSADAKSTNKSADCPTTSLSTDSSAAHNLPEKVGILEAASKEGGCEPMETTSSAKSNIKAEDVADTAESTGSIEPPEKAAESDDLKHESESGATSEKAPTFATDTSSTSSQIHTPPSTMHEEASSSSFNVLFCPPSPPSDISDTDSFPDFEFDSDLDMLPPLPPTPPPNPSSNAKTATSNSDVKTSGSDDEDWQPWNAVCVVGLRVYSQVKDADVELSIVRPLRSPGKAGRDGGDVTRGSDKDGDGNGKREQVLDRDDPAKGSIVKAESGDDKQMDETKGTEEKGEYRNRKDSEEKKQSAKDMKEAEGSSSRLQNRSRRYRL